LLVVGVFCALLQGARGQDQGTQLELRVVSSGVDATVLVDRGSNDGVAAGDPVLFRPRAGGEHRGVVLRVEERRASVQLHDRSVTLLPGTRGEVFVPAARRRREEAPTPAPVPPAPAPAKPPGTTTDRERWQNKDEGYTQDQPLLAQVKAIEPRDRRAQFGGRFFTFADVNYQDGDRFHNSILRAGVDTWIDNPWQRGGALRFDGEIDYRTEVSDNTDLDLTVREMSYREGGDRFTPTRWQVGRFLQSEVPQFGLLDGVAWSQRRENGHSYGASFGFLPELNDDMHTGEDLQLAVFYRWVDDKRETLALTGAFQKTFHGGKWDRDLFVFDARRLPVDSWDLRASVWIDLYTGDNRDAAKGKGIELTHAFASAGRRFDSGDGFDVAYRRLRFPATLRDDHGPIYANEIRNDRYDRLTFTGWHFLGVARHRAHGQLALFDDETTDGAALELGVDVQNAVFGNGHLDVTVFGNAGRVGSHLGARLTVGRPTDSGRWDVLYEIANHHFDGFTADRDDLIQHRVYGTRTFDLASLWQITAHAGAHLWDDYVAFHAGLYAQRSF
jgi:hypothetical protein